MAIVTNEDLEFVRHQLSNRNGFNVDYTKQQINLAVQAIEDWFEKPAVKQSLSTDIDSATLPFAFTNQQKMRIIRWYLKRRFDKGE